MAEAYAMVMLAEQGYADQNDIGRAFGYATRTIRRYQERFEEGGLQALGKSDGRQLGSHSVRDVDQLRDRTILHLKTGGTSNRVISVKVGLHEKTIRRRLRRLGWNPPDTQRVLFEEHFQPAIPLRPAILKVKLSLQSKSHKMPLEPRFMRLIRKWSRSSEASMMIP
jgi:transposase